MSVMDERNGICVGIVYAFPAQQLVMTVLVPAGSTVAEAIAASGIMEKCPDLAARHLSCAVFGRAVALDQELAAGDRIEILRPLLIDPKEGRRRSAARGRSGAGFGSP